MGAASKTTHVSLFGLAFMMVCLVVYVQLSMSDLEMKLLGAIHNSNDNNENSRTRLPNRKMTTTEDLTKGANQNLHMQTRSNTITSFQHTDPHYPEDLISCKALMNQPHSPYRDGQFLSRHTTPVTWHPRPDHSRALHHPLCRLHRYTAQEARQCLAGKHLFAAGDSLSRYQFLSLATFLHSGRYPPRFGRSRDGPCLHKDELGTAACSPPDQPNICMEGDWLGLPKDSWLSIIQAIGGKNLFDGHMEAAAIRKGGPDGIQGSVENYLYVSPPNDGDAHPQRQKPVTLSFAMEIGAPDPIRGFNFTGCAFDGTCNYTDEHAEELIQQFKNGSFDFTQPFVDAIGPNGALRQVLPPVDYAFYNRGIWGALTDVEKTKNISTNMHDFVGGDKGRCFFRTSTGVHFDATLERGHVRTAFFDAGCGFIDHAHLVADFNAMPYQSFWPAEQHLGNGVKGRINFDERRTVFWDSVHFLPWVYEELNNLKLNILCNVEESLAEQTR